MASLMVEIPGRHGVQYHRIDKPSVRLGRALDNDIILADPSVSPYHCVVRRNENGSYALHSLADENGIRVGGRRVDDAITLDRLPLEFDAGRTRIRILDPAHMVAPTRMISCHGSSACVFGNWGWALLLFSVLTLISAFDNYLSTPLTLTWQSFWRDQLIIMMVALGLAVTLLMINRITSHRWDLPSSLSFVSLLLSTALVLDLITPFADYFFTSPLPGFIVALAWSLILLPWAMGWFLVRLNHGNTAASIVFVVALLLPAAYYQLKEIVSHYDLLDTFSKRSFYSDTLSPWDKRLQNTLSIDEFAAKSMPLASPDAADR
ncbi:MAG: FHA domain-containing protein [Chromatiaceae bacterium]|nr:FHA domain-containing protein [Chromatiaceae bacterium]